MLRLIGKYVKNLKIDECDIEASTVFREIIPLCPQLTHLSMIGIETGDMDDLRQNSSPLSLTHMRLSISGDANANWVLSRCKLLNVLEIKTTDITFRDAFIALMSLPKLSQVYYTNGTNYKANTKWPLTDVATSKAGLEICVVRGDISFTGELLDYIIKRDYKTLRQLSIFDCPSMDNTLANLAIEPGLPCLEVLNIDRLIALEEWNLHTIISSCPTIQELTMSWNSDVTDNVLNDLKVVTKKLRKLDISHCNGVTGVGLQQVVLAHRGSLEKLVLNNCQRINSDAIRWAYEVLGRRVVQCKYDH